MTITRFVIIAVCAYLLGSLSFAIIVSKVTLGKDIRNYGSGNAGLTNAYRTMGAGKTLFVLLGDIAKGAAAITIGAVLAGPVGKLVAGIFVILGHMFPVYFGFRGGKGVVTAAAMMLMLDWRVFLICFALFAIVFAWKKTVSLSSICGCLLYPFATFFITYFVDYRQDGLPLFYVVTATVVAALIGATVIIKHRANIKRILAGEEPPISFKKKS